VCNHITALDGTMVAAALGRKVTLVALFGEHDGDVTHARGLLVEGDVLVFPRAPPCASRFFCALARSLPSSGTGSCIRAGVHRHQGEFVPRANGAAVEEHGSYFFFMNPRPM
jgi:hypothetical protein